MIIKAMSEDDLRCKFSMARSVDGIDRDPQILHRKVPYIQLGFAVAPPPVP